MYTRTYYDSYHNKMYLWEVVDGKRSRIEESPLIEYYVRDPKNESPIKDIYGNSVILQTSQTVKDMKAVADCVYTCETKIPADVKYLQKRYFGQKLKANMDDFNVCTVDIEVSGGYTGFNDDHVIKIKNKLEERLVSIKEFEHLYNSEYEVWDEKKQIWCIFKNSCYYSSSEFPAPETAKYPINLISMYLSKNKQLYTFALYPYTGNDPFVKNYYYCSDEKKMLETFIEFFRKQRIDVVSGWNVRSFDIPYIINRCKNLNIEKSLSPVNQYKDRGNAAGYHIAAGGYVVCGIAILDGLDLYKTFTYTKRESYSLQSIGMIEVGEGKKNYDGQINDLWKRDWNLFVEYNIQDVLLTMKIEQKLKFIELAINFCYQALIPFERVFATTAIVTGFIVKYLHERNLVLPDGNVSNRDTIPGAYVMAIPGFYRYVINFDVESLYPTIMRMFNLCTSTLVLDPDKENIENLFKTPLSEYKTWSTLEGDFNIGGVYYRKDIKGIIASIVDEGFKGRLEFKKKLKIAKKHEKCETISEKDQNILQEIINEQGTSEFYNANQLIKKIFCNSVYGCLGTPSFPLYNKNNAAMITLTGQDIIKYLSSSINNYIKQNWYKVVYKVFPDFKKEIKPLENDLVILIDTDSCHICLDEIVTKMGLEFKTNNEFRDFASVLEEKLFNPFFKKILDIYADKFGVKNIVNFKREKFITQKFILAKKKYADEVIDIEGEYYDDPKIKITGIEIVRTDTPSFCRNKIQRVVKEIFDSKAKDKEYILELMRSIKKDFIHQTATEIAIPTGISDYTKYSEVVKYYSNKITYPKACPIHVRAAINYNYMIKKYNLPLQPIDNGSKIKYIYVVSNKNELNQNIIGFINQWPEEFNNMFTLDYENQWQKTFESVIQRFFDVLKWGNIQLETNNLSSLFE